MLLVIWLVCLWTVDPRTGLFVLVGHSVGLFGFGLGWDWFGLDWFGLFIDLADGGRWDRQDGFGAAWTGHWLVGLGWLFWFVPLFVFLSTIHYRCTIFAHTARSAAATRTPHAPHRPPHIAAPHTHTHTALHHHAQFCTALLAFLYALLLCFSIAIIPGSRPLFCPSSTCCLRASSSTGSLFYHYLHFGSFLRTHTYMLFLRTTISSLCYATLPFAFLPMRAHPLSTFLPSHTTIPPFTYLPPPTPHF